MKHQMEIPASNPKKRRRFTVQQKRALLHEASKPGQSIAIVARRYDLSPSMMFQWRKAMDEAADEGLASGERVYSEKEVQKLKKKIAQLERTLGRQTLKNEILELAVEIGVEKKLISPKELEKLKDFK